MVEVLLGILKMEKKSHKDIEKAHYHQTSDRIIAFKISFCTIFTLQIDQKCVIILKTNKLKDQSEQCIMTICSPNHQTSDILKMDTLSFAVHFTTRLFFKQKVSHPL